MAEADSRLLAWRQSHFSVPPGYDLHGMASATLVKQTWANFQRHNAQWLAAALAYFAAFSIAPLIIVTVRFLGLFLQGHHGAMRMIFGYLHRYAGAGAGALQSIVTTTSQGRASSGFAQVVSWAIFVIAAFGLFSALQFALNTIWGLQDRKLSIWQMVHRRLSSFGVMLIVALLLLVSMVLNAALTAATEYLAQGSPAFPLVAKGIDFVVSFAVLWIAFAVLFQWLPDCEIAWSDVWTGAAITSLLFVVGQFLLGWYLGRAGITNGYGAFGALIVFLLWVNYSAQIVLFGAEWTRAYAERHGSFVSCPPTR